MKKGDKITIPGFNVLNPAPPIEVLVPEGTPGLNDGDIVTFKGFGETELHVPFRIPEDRRFRVKIVKKEEPCQT